MYELQRLLFYFILYSFIGWIIEGSFNLLTRGHFIKPNFLIMPIKPMYGFAALLLILSKEWLPLTLFLPAVFIIPTLIEFITAWLMDYYYNLRFWNYSDVALNYKGYICLKFSLYWGILSLSLIFVIHPALSILYSLLQPSWHFIYPITLIYLIFDFVWTLTHIRIKNKNAPSR